jgi:hypothetical protein
MHDQISEQAVSDVLAKVRSGVPTSGDFSAAVQGPLISQLSRWELWALVGFVRHERRQKWLGYIVETKLKGSGHELGAMGALAHPEGMEQSSNVPDTPGWRYFFHGRGCCLTHEDGTAIDVDFADDGSAEEIDPYFYSSFLTSAQKLEWTDAQLRYSSPLETAWHFDIERLGTMEYVRHKWRFRVTDAGRQVVERIEPVVDEINRLAQQPSADAQTKMAWLLAALGDSVAAKRILSNFSNDFADILAAAAARQTQNRASLIGSAAQSPDDSKRRTALTALATLGRAHVEPEVSRTLAITPPSSVHLLCLRIVESWDDPMCETLLVDALRQFSLPGGLFGFLASRAAPEKDDVQRPRNGFLVGASRLVLSFHTPSTISQQTEKIVRRVLAADRKACDAEAGLLLYLLSPALGLEKIQANLRNTVPITREDAAVFLAMIGTDEALDALIKAAAGPAENGGHEAACALSLLDDQRARVACEHWKRRNDGYEDAEATEIEFNGRKLKTWKMDDVMRAEMQSFVQGCSDRLRRVYGPLLSSWAGR